MSGTTPPERQSLRLNAAKKAQGSTTPPSTKNKPKGKTKNTAESHNHTGSIISYEDPETKRRGGYGNVGKWLKDKAVYEVDFTFTDMEDPYEQLDHCPLAFVEAHLVENGMGRAWLDALKKQMALDTPETAKKRRKKRHTKTSQETPIDPEHSGPLLDGSAPKITKKRKHRQLEDSEDSQDSEEDDSQKGKSPKSQKMSDESSLDPGVKALLSHAVREGIYSIRPNPDKRVKPFMSWNPKKKTSCIKMLIKRAPGIQALADKMRRNEFARLYSKHVRTLAHNERSAQIRQLKLLYLATSDFSMVSNYDVGNSNSHMMTE